MYETLITVQGNVVGDIDLRTTDSGKSWCSFRIAATERIRDRDSQQWTDGTTNFFTVKCWNRLATNVVTSLAKGMPVIVTGRLQQRRYEREVGAQTVSSYTSEIQAGTVGPDLSRGVATFERTKSAAVQRAEERALADVEMESGGPPPF